MKNLALMMMMISFMSMPFVVASEESEPQTVNYVNLEKYMGTWYEIAKFPNSFQKDCDAVTAEYRLLSSGKVSVINTCKHKGNNEYIKQAHGTAYVYDKEFNSKLKVSFVPLLQRWGWFAGDYWILALEEKDYGYALVGSPDRKFLWILSRTPTLDTYIIDELLAIAQAQAYDISKMTISPTWQL
ncbi:MAG: lipocalin family protein [Oligoflexia bacterium]|nr:lipocalin family protein [Oligoflexia bacterium]MBF0366332.1 lipocalin family protein [Oligoflexia bacterium]